MTTPSFDPASSRLVSEAEGCEYVVAATCWTRGSRERASARDAAFMANSSVLHAPSSLNVAVVTY